MSALQKLKAYFGMVPAEDMDDYDEAGYESDEYDSYPDRAGARSRRATALRGGYRPVDFDEDDDAVEAVQGRSRARGAWSPQPATRGALAVDSQRDSVTRIRPATESSAASAAAGRITTLHPKTYIEARTIGEHYREGTPVIINLTEMTDADARRLVDFAAGLAFALRGDIDKVTSKVFLLSPADVDVTAEQRRRIAEGGLFG
ncbi:cell division inhibitor SepF [Actinoalloteichus hoggarensis]|uniref:Cell division protein SepF n=1 Tax=Actinoalloteichus hoggarensis TaxID=1470176 RepID=A0A221W152_9PSEU|nr:cell division protein SepF [Actinoalloteichus hoggarensis]ASO19460.1 Cell division protein SepF [Actinoalloteichus hoggarensis]MBB5919835.1 cell division inhibitor SepF [Actinoalloteichus hoggarensis]